MTAPAKRSKHPLAALGGFCAMWTVLWAALGSLTDFGAYWLAWLAAGLAVPELYFVIGHIIGGPLSDNVWALEHLDFAHPLNFAEWTPMHWAITVTLWLLFAWLSVHIPFGYLR